MTGGRSAPQVATSRPRYLAGIAFAAGSAVAFGTLPILAKLAYRLGADPLPLLAARFAIAAALLATYRAVVGHRRTRPRRAGARLILLGALGYAPEASLFFIALGHAPAAVVGLVFYSYPLWTSLIAFATRLEPFRWQLAASLALGLGGVGTIFTLPGSGLEGPLLALAAALALAVYLILAQVLGRGIPPLAVATSTASGAAGALFLASLATFEGIPLGAVPIAFGLGSLTALAFGLLFSAIARIGSSRTAVAATVEPVATILLAAAVLGEPLSIRLGLGALLVVAALPVLASAAGSNGAPPGADSP
jgi:drug/metabolite transporter (DMT)-like permease